ncbi:MAG TPA: hypothetical protein VL948_11225 [Verrucomicrobiae bacterium]|jgi:hypothetical protein|nr:hypothetical protein [Verrucomicrobiae bacterium]
MSRALVIAVSFLSMVTAVHAQTTDPPAFSVGDTWKFSDGREVTVVKVDENGSALTGGLRDCPTCVIHFDKSFGSTGIVTESDGKPLDPGKVQVLFVGPSWRLYDFPLQVGKSWNFSAQGYFRGQVQQYDVAVKIAKYEDVKTKAGTFKAFKMERSWRGGRAPNTSTWSDAVWFAPGVKSVVKFTSMNQNATEFDLTSYSLK